MRRKRMSSAATRAEIALPCSLRLNCGLSTKPSEAVHIASTEYERLILKCCHLRQLIVSITAVASRHSWCKDVFGVSGIPAAFRLCVTARDSCAEAIAFQSDTYSKRTTYIMFIESSVCSTMQDFRNTAQKNVAVYAPCSNYMTRSLQSSNRNPAIKTRLKPLNDCATPTYGCILPPS